MKKYLLLLGAFLVVAGLSGYFFYGHLSSQADKANAASPAAGGQAVSVLTVENETIFVSRSLPGRISAFRQSQVRPQVNGLITERLFEEGANVKKGEQLYQIDDARYKAALVSAQADLRSARSMIASVKAKNERYQNLVEINAVSRQEFDDARADLDQANAGVAVAKAAVDVAQVNLDYTKVYAPIDGRIGRSLVTEGALVTANQAEPLAVITQLDPVYVDMQQPSGEAMQLQQALLRGQDEVPVTVMLGQGNEITYAHKGTLKFSEVTIDETTGSITLRATVPNPDDVLMPGLFVRASLAIGQKEALLVPQRATTRNPNGSLSVWVVDEENKAQNRIIEVGEAYESNWIVQSGLNAGETIIIEGYQKIASGALVSPTPWQPEQPETSKPPMSAEEAVVPETENPNSEEEVEKPKEILAPADQEDGAGK